MTPAANTKPLVRTAAGCFLACSTKPMALMDRTGNTQGIKFRIRPPRTASIIKMGRAGVSVRTRRRLARREARGRGGGERPPARPRRSGAAISIGTVMVSPPLCSVASNTPRIGPACGG